MNIDKQIDEVIEKLWLRALDMQSPDFKSDTAYMKAQTNYKKISKQAFLKIVTDNHIIKVAGKELLFTHSAVNKDMHLFINGYHNPDVCPECIQPGILVEKDKK